MEFQISKKLNKFTLITIPLLMIYCLMPDNLFPQDQNPKPDTTKTKADSSLIDSVKAKPDSTIIDSLKTKADSAKIDTSISGENLLKDKYESKPSTYDTTNKILLPLNLKKDKFAYFDASQSIDRAIPNNAFAVGEKLTFIIRYGPIKAGTAIMSIPKLVKKMGRECYEIQTEAKSSAFFSAFFKVRDKVISYMDKNGLFSWGFEKHLREGKYSSDRIVVYDQYNGWAVTNKKDSLRVPPCVHDILTSFYFIRTQKLEVGQSLFLDNHADNKLYPLEVKVHKKERIRVKAGTFNCVVVEPILRAEGLFKSKGRLLVWLTDDEQKIPVQMKSKIIIGYITAELKKMEGVKRK